MLRKWGAMHNLKKIRLFSVIALIIAAPSLAFADTTVASQAYVDTQDALKVDIAQGNANAGKTLVVNSSGNVSAGYISVPVANGDPSAAQNPGTVSSLASIWVQ